MQHPQRILCAAALVAGLALACSAPAHAQVPQADAAPAADAPADRISERLESSVVKIFATTRYPDISRPWTKQAPGEVTGTGVVIEGKRILTNAHVVLYAGQLQVQANQEGDKYSAHVVAISPGMDLAVLALDDETFFDRHTPLERQHALPDIKDPVLAYGFPVGGTSLSITKGIVSRIEYAAYNLTAGGLRIQIDAAINPGNSGGPAVVGDRMIGLAFSHLGNAQNIGYIIPNEEIDLFLRDVDSGRQQGKPALYESLQTLENPALRSYLHLAAGVHGVIVHRPARTTPDYPLREWDVITKVGDTPVDDQGMILLDRHLRVGMGYAVQRSARDGNVKLSIVREGRAQEVQVPVAAEHAMLVPELKGDYPEYFIYGPLVFSRATTAFVMALARSTDVFNGLSIIKSPLVTQRGDEPSTDREELVVIPSPLFPHAVSKGYSNPAGAVVYSINGTPVRSLRHLVELLRDLHDEYVSIEMDNRGGEALVFRRSELAASTEGILTDNGIRAQGSPDLMEVWQSKPAH
jgi:S1-C subfamily serine protease